MKWTTEKPIENCIVLGCGIAVSRSYEFAFSASGTVYRTIMTEGEHEIMDNVIRRAVEAAEPQLQQTAAPGE